MKSPLEEIIQWYENLPVSHRQDIAALLSNSLPGFQSIDLTDIPNLPTQFLEVIQANRRGKFAEAGLALTLRSSIEFFFISKRSSRSGWRETKSTIETIASQHPSEAILKTLQEVEFRAEQWIKTCEKWEVIRANSLRDDQLEAWCTP